MIATPFGPRPPAEIPDQPVDLSPQAAPKQTPTQPSAPDQPDAAIRSLSASPPPADATLGTVPDATIILDPTPMSFDEPRTQPAEPAEADPWWQPQLQAAEGQSLLPPMLMAMGVLLAIFVVMRALRRRQANRPIPPPPVDRIAAIHERSVGSISPIERAMADGEQLARRLAATMDNKAARIELLIEEADRKLEELNRAVAAVSRATPASPERGARTPRSIDPALLDLARVEQDRAERNGFHTHADDDRRPDRTTQHPDEQKKTIPAVPPPSPDDPGDHIHRRVWALADDGVPSMEIARSLNQPVGQVELILNLRKSG
jgi:hypothetical protein